MSTPSRASTTDVAQDSLENHSSLEDRLLKPDKNDKVLLVLFMVFCTVK